MTAEASHDSGSSGKLDIVDSIKHSTHLENIKAAPENMVKETIAGIADATVLNVFNTAGEGIMGPLRRGLETLVQLPGRAAFAIKDVATLHIPRAAAQLAVGVAETAKGAVRTGMELADVTGKAILRICEGTERAVVGLLGHKLSNLKGKMFEKALTLKAGIQEPTGVEDLGVSLFSEGGGGGAAAHGAH